VTPFGDRAIRFTIPQGAPRRRLFAELAKVPGARDVVLTEEIGCVVFDEVAPVDLTPIGDVLARASSAEADAPGTRHTIHVVYDGEDLDEVARAIGRSRDEVIALHSGAEYRVAMLGFLPGFAYLRGVPEELRLPRRAPRPRVPAGSVAIAADYTGIYPFASPGGWHLLGRAPAFVPFDTTGTGRAALAVGDVVRFTPEAASAPAIAHVEQPPPAGISGPHLELTRVTGLAILVDGGRPGRMHEGIPPGGPLVSSQLALANALVGNTSGTCAVEIAGSLEVTARGGAVHVADDTGNAVLLAEGECFAVSTGGQTRVRYVALAGGIAAPVILGGRGTLLGAKIGGPLRRGDRLVPDQQLGPDQQLTPDRRGTEASRLRPRLGVPPAPSPTPTGSTTIAMLPGPDASRIDLDALAATELRISPSSDRTGTRLEGPVATLGASHAAARSTPMVLGAIELTPSGLIVLGPDHPTTGGYPVVGVVRSASLDPLFARPLGSTVRLVVA
jgi:KipI family sensor histidine kinase inhibitor